MPGPEPCAPDCPVCGGVGYYRLAPDAEVGDPDFGKVAKCPNAQRGALQRQARSGGVESRVGLTADEVRTLRWELVRDGLSDGHKAREAVIRASRAGRGQVFLYGASGQAKTLTLKIAVAVAVREGRRAAYANLMSVLDDIRRGFDQRENKQAELARRMDWWLSLDVLAVDELDKANATDWARERIFQLIDARYQRALAGQSLTLYAANYDSTDSLAPYLRSRILDNRFTSCGQVVFLNGVDGRQVVPPDWPY